MNHWAEHYLVADKTSVASCLTAIQICLHPSAEDTNTKDKGDDTIAAKDANYVVENRLKVNTTPIAGVQTVREMTILIQHLKRELGAKEMNEILPKTRRYEYAFLDRLYSDEMLSCPQADTAPWCVNTMTRRAISLRILCTTKAVYRLKSSSYYFYALCKALLIPP